MYRSLQQTNMSDMLDLAVDYIKELQMQAKQVKNPAIPPPIEVEAQHRVSSPPGSPSQPTDLMATEASYPVQLFHRAGGGGSGSGGDHQWHNLGAGYAAVRVLRPQGHSLVMYAASPDDGSTHHHRRIVFAYPILPGDAFERLDGATLSWAEPGSGDEFALCFLDEAACAAVCGAISPVTTALAALDGVADRLAGLRVAAEEATGGDIAGRVGQLSSLHTHRP